MLSPENQLKRAFENKTLIPFIGAGVSIGAANLPSWNDILSKGVEYLELNRASLNYQKADIDSINSLRDAKRFIEGIQILQDCFGGHENTHYHAFLIEQFGNPNITSTETLIEIRKLKSRFIITTNYDLLLENFQVIPSADSETWLNPQRILSIIRGDHGIIHLHGRYDIPESVIFSNSDYERIVRKADVGIIARAIFNAGVLLFIGCSFDSTHDPHLGTILKEFSQLSGPLLDRSYPHIMLVQGKTKAQDEARLRRLGIIPITFGESYDDLPKFLNSIIPKQKVTIETIPIRNCLRAIRNSQTISEALENIKFLIETVIFKNRNVRVGFASKTTIEGRTVLVCEDLVPTDATHNIFSYPQTLAAWALIEGRIFAWPEDLDRACDFSRLRLLKKIEKVKDMLLTTDPERDEILREYLNADNIKTKTKENILTIRDIYQHWVGRQPTPHYCQFISVPVPIIDKISNFLESEEYGVFNIDTPETQPLLTEEIQPLLELASELTAQAFKIIERS